MIIDFVFFEKEWHSLVTTNNSPVFFMIRTNSISNHHFSYHANTT